MLSSSGGKHTWVVAGVCCATEENVLRKSLDGWLGPAGYSFNSVTGELVTSPDVHEPELVARLRDAGFEAKRRARNADDAPPLLHHRDVLVAGGAAVLMVISMVLERLSYPVWLSRGLLLTAIVIGGWRIAVKAVKAVRLRALDMNVLMTAAVCGALAIGKWDEGAAVIVLFAIALMLESYSTARTRRAIASLMALSPDHARMVENGAEITRPARDVLPGSRIVIRPGERLPLDGIVEEGCSAVDESPITGESVQREKSRGDEVYAGSMNQHGMLVVRVTRAYDDTTLARIVHSIESAEQSRAPMQNLVDRIAAIYTPTVFVGALLVAVVPPVFLGEEFGMWLYRALVLLVIACPCALVISTPVTIVSALTGAARCGVLVKGGKYLEAMSRIRAIAFDKTGTLTEGRPRVTDVIPLDSITRNEAVSIVAALERFSDHHLAPALMAEAGDGGTGMPELLVDGFEALPGRGVRGIVKGRTYFLGNEKLARDEGFSSARVQALISELSGEGKTTVILGSQRKPLCVVATRDTARQQSRRAIEKLRAFGINHLVMLSGDQSAPVERIAEEVGLGRRVAGMLPDEKVRGIRELRGTYGSVAMVGDGINDSPAMKAADVGIAMGVSGSDTALETADIVLMSDDLMRLPTVIGLSRKAMRIIRQNVAIALALKLAFLALSLAGFATLWMALLADDGAALIVILNGLRALSPPRIS